jgi:hypothetical protein
MDRLRESMRRQLSDLNRPVLVVQRHNLEETERKLEQATRRLVEVSPDMIAIVETRIRELTTLHEQQWAAIQAASRPVATLTTEIDGRIAAGLSAFARMEEAAVGGDRVALRQMLRTMVARVEIYARQIPLNQRRNAYELERGVLYINGVCPEGHGLSDAEETPSDDKKLRGTVP